MARLGFCGACPTETETSRREAGFPRFFVLTNPSVWIVRCCTMVAEVPYGMHTRKRSGPQFSVIRSCSNPPRRGLASVGVGVLGAPDPAPEAVTNYYVTPPPPPWKTDLFKPLPCSPLK